MNAERLQYKLDFFESFFAYAGRLRDKGHSLVICGDYNTAHNEIDLKNPIRIQDIVEQGWVKDAVIENKIFGSDHCPVGLTLEV